MSITTILSNILLICFSVLIIYFKSKSELIEKITEFISRAEEEYKGISDAGGKKFQWVVDNLYNLLPSLFKAILSKGAISKIVQAVFDHIEEYTKIQLDKVVYSINNNK